MTRPRLAAAAWRLPLRAVAGAGVSALVLAGCIVVPTTREVYDPECQMVTRHITLETAALGGLQSCAGDGCVAMLTAMGVVTAASVVVSGSIALVGNAVYWMERKGRCVKPTPWPEALPPAVPASAPAQAAPRPAAAPT
jgi:hypothetical protein